MTTVESWGEIGERIRQARLACRMSQVDVGAVLGTDRSAVARIESGRRQVNAMELFALSDAFKVPIAHFLTRSPVAVASRRAELTDDADQAARARFRADAALEAHVRDAEWLHDQGLLAQAQAVEPTAGDRASWAADPRSAARRLRERLGVGIDPLGPMATVCGGMGLHIVVLEGFEGGASLALRPGLGAAVVGGDTPPGRRRFTAAHELAHFVLQDEYSTDIAVSASRDERERAIDAFAGELLLPREAVASQWEALRPEPARRRLVHIAGRYRVSWSVAVRAAVEAGLVPAPERAEFLARAPQRAEFLEALGHEPPVDLPYGETSPEWRRATMAAWRNGTVTASRVVELLHDAITADDLPDDDREDAP